MSGDETAHSLSDYGVTSVPGVRPAEQLDMCFHETTLQPPQIKLFFPKLNFFVSFNAILLTRAF